ncbi:transglutaminase-like putative cysteine protease [Caulobacter ginsengisoli]|uniref:Transglutaminase-like putative cysteine protease n=1 Tax=Caulobacter ginsengisoli TaxID=400775 RepID=A0ABU0IX44_9CAUL|nr:transglutaminase family protein [Caulobacter ginsengisoli]MDQ0466570.1 transglutaminase-like putative cysteine protease [Caulobacter ginsengisoli]
MPILSIRHLTRYRYRKPVMLGEHRMMFRPLESYDQRVLSASVTISPEPHLLRHVHDVFGNAVGVASFLERTTELCFESRVTLDHRPVPAFDGVDSYEERLPFAYSAQDMPDLLRSMERAFPDPEGTVERWARSFLRRDGGANLQRLLADMTQAIHSDFRYGTRLQGGAQSPAETLASRTGACRDFAVLMMEAVRSLGLAAQFVSGYIYVPPRPVTGLIGTSRLGGGHTHAWLRVFLPACGWVEFDPTNGIVGNADLIRVAIARDPRQALPLWGSWSGESDDYLGMDVEVDVVSEEEPALSATFLPDRQPDLRTGVG